MAPRAVVLMVESDVDLERGLRRQIEPDGYGLVTVESGAEMVAYYSSALRQPDCRVPDIIVVDLQDDSIVGDLEVLRMVDWTVPIVGVADPGARQRWREAYRLGVTDVMSKPVRPEALGDMIRDLAPAVATPM